MTSTASAVLSCDLVISGAVRSCSILRRAITEGTVVILTKHSQDQSQPATKLSMDNWVLGRMRPLGRLIRDAELAIYTRTLATLLTGGVLLAAARIRDRVRGGPAPRLVGPSPAAGTASGAADLWDHEY